MISWTGLSISPRILTRKIFVSYHHRGDQSYYDAFSTCFHDSHELVYDNSLDRRIESNDVDYVMRKIREEYISGTSCTVVLVGWETSARKYVDWEILATLDKQHGLIGVRLPSARLENGKVIVPDRLYANIQSGYAIWTSWEALNHNPAQLQASIEEANAKPKHLICNDLPRRLRNG